eukprot:TRINITY_DN2603_c0_g2_i2.p1 TRINITY_DN2603_c0_g2~~TRINITY_DN2603_c0_g2_i2.p1  ORF type:complete len:341 (-),score=49.18 TRINITY_DN2603_c0_g2_i2:10-978(-)
MAQDDANTNQLAQPLSGGALFSLTVVESTLVLIHFLFGLMICKEFLHGLLGSIFQNQIPDTVALLMHSTSNLAVLYWLVYRLASDMRITPLQLAHKLGLNRFRVSFSACVMILLHVFGLGLIAYLQHTQGEIRLNLDNFHKDGKFDLTRSTDMLIFAPLREEIVFRAVLFITIYRRYPHEAVRSLVASNFLFGLIHLTNLYGSRFSAAYIGLQVLLGLLVGSYYSLRFVVGGCLWETLLLHFANNVCSCFLPLNLEWDLQDYSITIPLAITLLAYNIAIALSIRDLSRHKNFCLGIQCGHDHSHSESQSIQKANKKEKSKKQ